MSDRDRLHAQTSEYRSRVTRSIDTIRQARNLGRIGVSFSGGKDSLVTLHLVRSVDPQAPAAIFDSGCEMPETLELARHYGVQIIPARLSYPELARYSGWWGYRDPVDKDCPFDVRGILIEEPSETFIVRERLTVCAMGLRAEESRARSRNARARGMLYRGADRTWYLCPLAFWSVDDVWAYIYEHELRYHPAYDAMTRIGIPRERQRIGMSMGVLAIAAGNIAILRRIAPEHFSRLAAEFPAMRDVS